MNSNGSSIHAAISENDRDKLVVGVGLVIRDYQGMVMATSAQCICASYSPLLAEAVAVLRGITLAIETGLTPCVIETEALDVVKLIQTGKASLADMGWSLVRF
ncbi:hypothetical protein Dsin_014137 [Dipteronia sinensis]|uniref:RNase H type-1 domain-containing protein n=1 Tax=Dipteronia sinensis TaxID=43782 RepID=A0AAE0AME4_9ROSI|nr:hypothetical protein Dsin_014137 [Dipteronia sinensis]